MKTDMIPGYHFIIIFGRSEEKISAKLALCVPYYIISVYKKTFANRTIPFVRKQ
jgi:hypothetical protein